MSEQHFTLIGVSDSRRPVLLPEAAAAIASAKLFAGGKRHREIMQPYLPDDSEWIEITVPLEATLERLRQEPKAVIFASGDPLFYGFANTLMREIPEAELTVIPWFNSLQMLAHKSLTAYHSMTCVSLTGRPWKEFDNALIECRPLIGVLTDRKKTPAEIARRMLEYGYSDYEAIVGHNLGNEELEEIKTFSLQELAKTEILTPNCMILRATAQRHRRLGIDENQFECLPGRPNMITKMPYRLTALAMLNLHRATTLWDVGCCTGSVSIEARLSFPHLDIVSFEIRSECEAIVNDNAKRFGAPGLNLIIGDFLAVDLSHLTPPDAVFIGGHGGKLDEIISRLSTVLLPGGCIVFNSVSEASCETFIKSSTDFGLTVDCQHRLALDSHNPITIIRATK